MAIRMTAHQPEEGDLRFTTELTRVRRHMFLYPPLEAHALWGAATRPGRTMCLRRTRTVCRSESLKIQGPELVPRMSERVLADRPEPVHPLADE